MMMSTNLYRQSNYPYGFVSLDISKIDLHHSSNPKVVFLDRDGVINQEKSYIQSSGEMNLYPFASHAIKCLNDAQIPVLVVTNQSAVARGYLSLDTLHEIHWKMTDDLLSGGAVIQALFYCPHLPPERNIKSENNKFIVECKCRKPGTGLFEVALNQLGIEKKQTKMFMVGDSERDIIAGHTFGCITLGVKTGHGCKNSRITPDYMCENLEDAVDKILRT